MFKNIIVLCGGVSLFLSVGCESKYFDSTPKPIAVTQTIEGLDREKSKIDEKLNKLDETLHRIKGVESVLRRAINSRNNQADFNQPTVLDIILDLNDELKGTITKQRGEKIVRESTLRIDSSLITERCKDISVRLEANDLATIANSSSDIRDVLTYSVRSCSSQDYLPILDVKLVANNIELKVNTKNLKDALLSPMMVDAAWSCDAAQSGQEVTDVTCQNVPVQISDTVRAVMDNMTYSAYGDTRVDLSSSIYENDTLKAKAALKVQNNGKIDFNLDRVSTAK